MGRVSQTHVHRRAAPTQLLWRQSWRRSRFTLAEARRALPYVARIIQDAAEAFEQVRQARQELQQPVQPMRRLELDAQRDAALRRLNSAIDECNAVGVDLLDIHEGLVRFNADVDGHSASLLWHLGEPVLNAWQTVGP
jgi:hypothetical protein